MAFNLPKALSDPSKLQARGQAAIGRDASWRNLLEDCYDYFLPQRENFKKLAAGQKKMDQIFDSTSINGMQDFAARMQEQITPLWRKWAKFELSRELQLQVNQDPKIDEKAIQIQLDNISDVVFDYINHSNFGTQINEAYLDLGIGTAVLTVEESRDPNVLIEFGTIKQFEIGFEEGVDGGIENIFRTVKVKARNIKRKWPDCEPSDSLKDTIKNSPEESVKFLECMVYDFDTKDYWRIVFENGADKVLWAENDGIYGAWVAARWSKMPDEVRGRGVATFLLPDVRSLNKLKEFALRKAAIDLSGIWTAVDDGVMNPYTIRIQPGIVIPVGTNDRTSPSLQRLDTTNNLQLTQFNVEQLQFNIKRGLYNDLRDPTGAVKSATEVSIEQRELANRIGSSFGRLQTEMLQPILRRVVNILIRNGKIPPIKINGNQVTIKFTSPLAQAQEQEELYSVQQAVEFVAMTAGNDIVPLVYDLAKFGQYAADRTGMSPALVRTPQEIEKGQQEIIAAQKQAMQETGKPLEG